ncbi:MAG: TauD/TfdA family dioxygenase [Sphingomonadales bacterium]|nr:TauD/TfdA family dioxygenase [Sphingomonadales bacterium]
MGLSGSTVESKADWRGAQMAGSAEWIYRLSTSEIEELEVALAYETNAHLPFHTDGSDLVGLLCLRDARSGGLSSLVSSVACHNELARTRPDLLERLTSAVLLRLARRASSRRRALLCNAGVHPPRRSALQSLHTRLYRIRPAVPRGTTLLPLGDRGTRRAGCADHEVRFPVGHGS